MIAQSHCIGTDPYTLDTTLPAFDSRGVLSVLTFCKTVSNGSEFMTLNTIKLFLIYTFQSSTKNYLRKFTPNSILIYYIQKQSVVN
jgi:hypothetical protein